MKELKNISEKQNFEELKLLQILKQKYALPQLMLQKKSGMSKNKIQELL